MALIVADRVLETSTTTGTGSYTLAGAVLGYRAVPAPVNLDTLYYFAESVDASGVPNGDWEVGLGTWGTGATLARTAIHASSAAGAAVNWPAGTRRIGLGLSATQLGLKADRTLITGVTGAVAEGGAGSTTLHVITANNADVTTTAVVTQLTATGFGLGWWQVEYNLHWGASATATGINFVVSHSGAAAPFMATRIDPIGSTTALATVGISHQTAEEGVTGNLPSVFAANANTGSLGPNAGVTTADSIQFSTITALFLVTTAGSLLLQVGSEVAASGVRLKAGSNARYTKLS